MQELRTSQKQLVSAKKRRNKAKIKYLQFHIAELQKERGETYITFAPHAARGFIIDKIKLGDAPP